MNMEPREFIDMAVAKEVAVTRPAQVQQSKMGSSGTAVQLITNFFPLQTVKEWDIFQYRVDFVPDIPDTRIRKSLLAREKQKVGGNCFDGTMMFTVKRLGLTEITTKLPNTEDVIQIKIREVGIMSRTDQRFLQIYNIILNRAMVGLKLSQLGRNYYDGKAAVSGRSFILFLFFCSIVLWGRVLPSVIWVFPWASPGMGNYCLRLSLHDGGGSRHGEAFYGHEQALERVLWGGRKATSAACKTGGQ